MKCSFARPMINGLYVMGPEPIVTGMKYSVAPTGEREVAGAGGCAEELRVTGVATASAALGSEPCAAPPAAFPAAPAFRGAISREISGPVSGPRRYESAHRL